MLAPQPPAELCRHTLSPWEPVGRCGPVPGHSKALLSQGGWCAGRLGSRHRTQRMAWALAAALASEMLAWRRLQRGRRVGKRGELSLRRFFPGTSGDGDDLESFFKEVDEPDGSSKDDHDAEDGIEDTIKKALQTGTKSAVKKVEKVLKTPESPPASLPDIDQGLLERAMWFLARAQRIAFAIEQVEDWQKAGMQDQSAKRLFHAILRGISHIPPSEEPYKAALVGYAEAVILSMRSNLLTEPDSETVTYLLRVNMQATSSVKLLLEQVRSQCPKVQDLQGSALESFSAAFLREGDLNEAYACFLASQLAPEPPSLGADAKKFTRQHVSQLLRALAIGGMALEVRALLQMVEEKGGRLWRAPGLPTDTCAAMLAGRSAGRTLATVWLEPSEGYLKRKAMWASDPDLQVTVAEQHNWETQDCERRAMQDWAPFLDPSMKVERAWLSPLYNESGSGALGLLATWAGGESLPAQVARHRTRVREETVSDENSSQAEATFVVGSSSRPLPSPMAAWTVLERSWRVHHADVVKGSFLTGSRANPDSARSSERLQEQQLAWSETHRMAQGIGLGGWGGEVMGKESDLVPEYVKEALQETLQDRWATDEKRAELRQFVSMTAPTSMKVSMIFDHLQISTLLFDIQGHPMIVVYKALKEWAYGATPQLFCTIPEGEYCEGIVDDPPALPVLSLSFLGEELSMQLQGKLETEFKEAERYDGSAEEELKLALEISKLIRQLGGVVTDADVHSMCEKAYSLNNPELAGEVLRDHLEEMQREPPEDEPCAAELAYKELLVRGGWEPNSVDDFIAGRRPDPVTDPESIFGSLKTNKADPLQGIEDESARERALKKLLQKEAPRSTEESDLQKEAPPSTEESDLQKEAPPSTEESDPLEGNTSTQLAVQEDEDVIARESVLRRLPQKEVPLRIKVRYIRGDTKMLLSREDVEKQLRRKASIVVQEFCAGFSRIVRGAPKQMKEWFGKLGLRAPVEWKEMVQVLNYARLIAERLRENEKKIEQSLYDAMDER